MKLSFLCMRGHCSETKQNEQEKSGELFKTQGDHDDENLVMEVSNSFQYKAKTVGAIF
ncbi:MAG TPA: hypothetical protein VIU12_31165 [Chryseolinea sp.]